MDCLFCRIIAGEIPASKVYEDDSIFAFRDLRPGAPTHILLVPKRHLAGLAEATASAAVRWLGLRGKTPRSSPRIEDDNAGCPHVLGVARDQSQAVD